MQRDRLQVSLLDVLASRADSTTKTVKSTHKTVKPTNKTVMVHIRPSYGTNKTVTWIMGGVEQVMQRDRLQASLLDVLESRYSDAVDVPSPPASEDGTTYKVIRTFTRKPRPESGLDCLSCAKFAR